MRKREVLQRQETQGVWKRPVISKGSRRIVEEKQIDKTPVRERPTKVKKSPETMKSSERSRSPRSSMQTVNRLY